MNLDAFRDAVLAEARAHAQHAIDEAERHARARVDEAERQAQQRRDQARHEGREVAERELRGRRAEARREARGQVLSVRRDALDRLREEALQRLSGRAGTSEGGHLHDRLAELARRQLGEHVEIDVCPDGGLVARAGRRQVDYRLPALVDRAMQDLGADLEELWR